MSAAVGPTRFSTDTSADAFTQHASVKTSAQTPPDRLAGVYELERCINAIKQGGYERAALQFPDYLLVDSAAVAIELEKGTGKKVFILGDTSYGSCCVDEVTAEHLNADVIIHYGHTCLSPVRRLPTLYVFAGQPVDPSHCVATVEGFITADQPIILLYDVTYAHAADSISERLRAKYTTVVQSKLEIPETANQPRTQNHASESPLQSSQKCCGMSANRNVLCCQPNQSEVTQPCCRNQCSQSNQCCGVSTSTQPPPPQTSDREDGDLTDISQPKTGDSSEIAEISEQSGSGDCRIFTRCGRRCELPEGKDLSDFTALYVGQEGLTLTNLMFSFNKCRFVTYDPSTQSGRVETLNINQALMRRYYLVQKAKDASVVGILVGTLGVADYLGVLSHLKKIIKNAGKKSYTFVMGKLNEFKVANFPEIDIFVLIACPENVLIDSRDYFRPVVTPFEMELACVRGKEWTGDYTTDFRELLPRLGEEVQEQVGEDTDDDEPDFSPITGEFRRNLKLQATQQKHTSTDLTVRDSPADLVPVTNAAAHHLAGRAFRGLEVQAGQTEVTKAVEGSIGIARGYAYESHNLPEGAESIGQHIRQAQN